MPTVPLARRAWLLAALLIACKPAETSDRAPAANRDPAANRAAATADSRSASDSLSPADSLLGVADTARIRGAANAPVWIVEVSDFQCPYCRMWHEETYPTIVREYVATGKARIAFLNLPLPSHRHAWPAAESAMCAGLQGRFWEMHDAIFRTQARWSPLASADSVFARLAREVGIDTTRWQDCMTSHALRPLIEADYQRAVSAGVNSTPSFFIGDRRLAGAQPADSFRVAIDAAIARAAATPAPR